MNRLLGVPELLQSVEDLLQQLVGLTHHLTQRLYGSGALLETALRLEADAAERLIQEATANSVRLTPDATCASMVRVCSPQYSATASSNVDSARAGFPFCAAVLSAIFPIRWGYRAGCRRQILW